MLLLLGGSPALARPFAAGEFTDEDLLVVSKMAVLEAGWKSRREHVALAFVQLKRWRRTRDSHIHFRDQVVDYCPGLRNTRKVRQRWVSELTLEGARPKSFPKRLNWRKHQRWWFIIVRNMRAWSEGKRRDPMRGRAWHWRSKTDPPTKLKPLWTPGFRNIFYGRT